MPITDMPSYTTNAPMLTIQPSQSKIVLTINADGQVMRGDAPLESLTKEQLIVVVNELIDLVRRRGEQVREAK